MSREGLILEQAATLRAAPPQNLVILVQVLQRPAEGADAPVLVSAVLKGGGDPRHGLVLVLVPGLSLNLALGLEGLSASGKFEQVVFKVWRMQVSDVTKGRVLLPI